MNGVKDQKLEILFENFYNQEYFQEYERAVIFRLGRLLKSGARGPGVFFIIPCVDHYEKIDMRTQTYDVPPQEVKSSFKSFDSTKPLSLDIDQGFRDSICECNHVLQSQGCYKCSC